MQTSELVGGNALLRFLARHWLPVLVGAVVLPVALYVAGASPLWLDEILTYHVLAGGDLRDLWHRLATGTQSDPPLFYLAARACTALFGDNNVAFRLPSVLGILVMGLAVYAFVARRCSLAYARAALLLTLLPPVLEHFCNARPYGLWLGLSGLGLLCWQVAGDSAGWRRTAALFGLALCSAASVSTHYYAVLFLAALGLAEAFRAWSARRLDVPVWLALGVAVVPLLAFRPLIENAKSFIAGSWASPNLTGPYQGLVGVYRSMLLNRIHFAVFAVAGLALVAQWLWRTVRPGPDARTPDGPRADQLVAGLAVLAVPFLGWVLAVAYTNNYDLRYVLPAVCGMAALVPMALSRLARGRALPGHVLALAAAAVVVYAAVTRADQPSSLTLGRRVWPEVQEADVRARDTGRFFVTSRLHTFVETKFYHPEVRLLYVCLATHPATNAVARRLRTYYDGILEPEDLQDLDPYLVIGDRALSGHNVVEMIENNEVPYEEQAALPGGQPVYLVNPRPPATAGRADPAAAPLGR